MAEPTRSTDPLLAASTDLIGGPLGRHAGPASWWTPMRVLLALVTITFALGMVQKSPCLDADGASYDKLCYSDIDKLYASRGFAEGLPPFVDDSGRYPYFEYPVLTGGLVFLAAEITHAVWGTPDVADLPADQVGANPQVREQVLPFTTVNAVLLFCCALVAVWALAKVHRRRPWDAALVAAAPMLLFAGLINWDLLAVALVALALLAWSRDRPLLTGVALGLGMAAKLYPLFLLGPVMVLCVRDRRWRDLGWAVLGTAASWLAVNLPVLVANPPGWLAFWSFNSARGPDLGSLWYAWQLAGQPPADAHTINVVSWIVFGSACVAVAVLGLFSEHRPRMVQLAFLVVVAFLIVNKVYSPQYVLWLLPLAALARPRWRDILIWQGCEAVYFVAIWVFLQGDLASSASGAPPTAYIVAILVRVAGQLWLAGLVVRDILWPEHDPVRAGQFSADPDPVEQGGGEPHVDGDLVADGRR